MPAACKYCPPAPIECHFDVNAHCVRYTGPELDPTGILNKDTLDVILQKINELFHKILSGESNLALDVPITVAEGCGIVIQGLPTQYLKDGPRWKINARPSLELRFRIGDADSRFLKAIPLAGVSTFTLVDYGGIPMLQGKKIDLYRQGLLQYPAATDGDYQFNILTGQVQLTSPTTSLERFIIKAYEDCTVEEYASIPGCNRRIYGPTYSPVYGPSCNDLGIYNNIYNLIYD